LRLYVVNRCLALARNYAISLEEIGLQIDDFVDQFIELFLITRLTGNDGLREYFCGFFS
jgi:hypothetical protein